MVFHRVEGQPRCAAAVARPLPWVNFATSRPGVPKVSFLASRPIHTGGHDRALAEGRLGVGHLTTWARLQDGVVEINTECCPNCGGKPEIIGAIVEQWVIAKILTHLGLDPQFPPKGRARERSTLLPEPRPPSQTHRHRLQRQTAAGMALRAGSERGCRSQAQP